MKFKSPSLLSFFIISLLVGIPLGIFLTGLISKDEVELEDWDVSDRSRYVSSYDGPEENLTTSNLLDKDSAVPVENNVNREKQGVLQEDPQRKVVKFNTELTASQKKSLEEEYDFVFTEDTPKNGVYVVNTASSTDLLERDDLVALVEVDKPIKLLSQQVDWGVQRIGANKVWEETDGLNVVVAVVDTGVQIDHEDLKNNITSGYDFVNNRENASDDNGHGTHVAGIIAAYNNSVGIVGGAHKAKIMPIKVLNAQGYGYLSDVAKGIYYAADNGAKIVNLSLGTDYNSSILKDSVEYAHRKGVLVVGAAGNSSGSSCVYPAAYAEVICVVATDQDNKLASFSNKGGELSAPGVSNYSTYIGNRYAYLSGTSMATPHVVASAALVFSYCSDCSTSEVREVLRGTAIDLGDPGQDSIFGYGLVDVFASIEYLTDEEEQEEEKQEEEKQEEKVEEEPEEKPKEEEKQPALQPTPAPTPTPSPSPTPAPPSPKPTPIRQRLSIVEPRLGRDRRLVLENREDVELKFELVPEVKESSIREIVVFLDNEKVYSVEGQRGEYNFEIENLTNNQYFIRVVAYYKNGRQESLQFVFDLTRLKMNERNNRANPNIPFNRRVLGVSTEFKY